MVHIKNDDLKNMALHNSCSRERTMVDQIGSVRPKLVTTPVVLILVFLSLFANKNAKINLNGGWCRG